MTTTATTLGPILCASVLAPDLDAVARDYVAAFGYRELEHATVERELAGAWGAPQLAGARTVLLGPSGRDSGLVRLIEADGPADGGALRAPGWRSIEICVTDVHAVRRRLEGTSFRVVGEPAPLPGNETIHAMQAIGPAGELLYLTEIGAQAVFELPTAVEPVDRVFIAVLSAPDLELARDWYGETFGTRDPAGSLTAALGCVNVALGLAAEREHTFCAMQLRGRNALEVDGHPAELAGARTPADGPAPLRDGIAHFSFGFAGRLEQLGLPFLTAPRAHAAAPYGGRRSAVTIGPAGERIELVELDAEA